MSNIVLLQPGAQLPAYMLDAESRKQLAAINTEVMTGMTFPTISIKGKVFAVVRGDERKIVTRPDEPETAAASINVVVVRANSKSRVFFAKQYVEGEQGPESRPDCASTDGITPIPGVAHKQSDTCALCPQAVWGSRANMEGKGTACSVNTRMAVFDPEAPTFTNDGTIETFLLRAPAASRAGFNQVVQSATGRGIPYNAMVMRLSFDMEAATPKLIFKPIGFLTDDMYQQVQKLYESENVKDMMGMRLPPPAPAPTQADKDMDELKGQPPAGAATAPAEPPPPPPPPPPAPAPVAAAPAASTDPFAAMDGAAAPAPAPAAAPRAPRTRSRAATENATAPAAAPAEAPAAAPVQPPAQAPAAPAAAPVAAAGGAGYDDLLGQLDTLLGATDD